MQKKQTFEVLGEAAVCFAGLLTLFFGCYLFGCMLAGSLAGELIEVIDGLFPNAIRGYRGRSGALGRKFGFLSATP